MSWVNRWKGKYVKIDPKNPSALGQCDESGLTFNHKDLVKQMEWRGDNLVWTGLMVGKPYLDVPNEQLRPPLVKDDPKVVRNPRVPGLEIEAVFGVNEYGKYARVGPPLENNPSLPLTSPPTLIPDIPIQTYSDPEYPVVSPYKQLLLQLKKVRFQ